MLDYRRFPENAYRKAILYVKKYDWMIEDIEIYPIKVTRSDFDGRLA